MKNFDKILNSNKTVFSYNDLSLILGINNRETLKSYFFRALKSKIMFNIYKGIYILANYNKYELAIKLKKKSYISFETVLKDNGIIFQDYLTTIFLASDNTISKKIGNINYQFNKIKDSILLNPLGLINKKNYTIASIERAICDKVYLSSNYYFDNLENIDKQKLIEISQIYNKRVILEIKKLINYVK